MIWTKKRKLSDDNDEEPDKSSLLNNLLSFGFKKQGDNVTIIDNNIYFQDDISMDSIGSLNKEMRALQNKLLDIGRAYSIDPPPIRLHITTYGGCIYAALSAIDCINELKVDVHTIIDGYVASAGTLISVCGKKRFIKNHAYMLIHELRSGLWGKYSEIEDEATNLKELMKTIKKIYLEHTNIKKQELDEILKKDLNWNATICLSKKLVDHII
jgi:ATP-dependent protease ClpP protease subunit